MVQVPLYNRKIAIGINSDGSSQQQMHEQSSATAQVIPEAFLRIFNARPCTPALRAAARKTSADYNAGYLPPLNKTASSILFKFDRILAIFPAEIQRSNFKFFLKNIRKIIWIGKSGTMRNFTDRIICV